MPRERVAPQSEVIRAIFWRIAHVVGRNRLGRVGSESTVHGAAAQMLMERAAPCSEVITVIFWMILHIARSRTTHIVGRGGHPRETAIRGVVRAAVVECHDENARDIVENRRRLLVAAPLKDTQPEVIRAI